MNESAKYDVVVIGGGLAGLSAALVLGRSRRRTLVIDAGQPRNAPSSGVHGYFSRDGILPKDLLHIGREELAHYPDVEVRPVRAESATGQVSGFEVALADGSVVQARKLLLATGVSDELPDKPGFYELWGDGVYHCPYCHGWEVRDRPLAVLGSGEDAIAQLEFIRNWSRDIVLLTDGSAGLDERAKQRLGALGVPVLEKPISHLEGSRGNENLERIVFEDGTSLEREGLFCSPPQRQRSGIAASLGCQIDTSGAGDIIRIDPISGETSVPGVYAIGDASYSLSGAQSAIMAVASGSSSGFLAAEALVEEDTEAEIERVHHQPGMPTPQ
jgi:thioredoxin reductase